MEKSRFPNVYVNVYEVNRKHYVLYGQTVKGFNSFSGKNLVNNKHAIQVVTITFLSPQVKAA
jgi:hypothetical protein